MAVTAHTESIAFCAAFTTPSPLHSVPTIPMASTGPLPGSECVLICRPITGNCPSTEVTMLRSRPGFPRSTIPRTVTKTINSRKNEKKP